jgi:hypothetical protein
VEIAPLRTSQEPSRLFELRGLKPSISYPRRCCSDVRSPGVSVQPIITIDGVHEANDVFLDVAEQEFSRSPSLGFPRRCGSPAERAHRDPRRPDRTAAQFLDWYGKQGCREPLIRKSMHVITSWIRLPGGRPVSEGRNAALVTTSSCRLSQAHGTLIGWPRHCVRLFERSRPLRVSPVSTSFNEPPRPPRGHERKPRP